VTGSLKIILPLAGLLVLLMAWVAITDLKVVNSNFLPSPGATGQAAVDMMFDAPPLVPDAAGKLRPRVKVGVLGVWETFRYSSGVQGTVASVKRIAQAVMWSCLIGIPIGILLGAFGGLEAFFRLIILPMRNAPITAFVPLFLLMYGIAEALKVNFLVFGTVVYIIPMTFDAVRNVRPEIVDKAVDQAFKPASALWFYVLPSALPRIYDSVRVCTGIAWTYLVLAETMNVTDGLGSVIANAGRLQNTPRVWAGILIIIILGNLTDALFKLGQRLPMLNPEEN
jgi:ABC-type nitrate/sulfonate/bicarbonate transport system permease component